MAEVKKETEQPRAPEPPKKPKKMVSKKVFEPMMMGFKTVWELEK